MNPLPSSFDAQAAASTGATTDPEPQLMVDAERTRTLYELTPQGLTGSALFACVLAWSYQDAVGLAPALGWLLAKLLTHLIRYLDWTAYARCPAAQRLAQEKTWRWRHGLLSGLDGLGWGLGGVLFHMGASPLLDGLLVASLVGVSSLGVFTLTSRFSDAFRFAAFTLGPQAVMHLVLAGEASTFIAASSAIYLGVLAIEGRKAESRNLELLRLRFANAAIAERHRLAVLQAEASNTTKSRFLATVSHELRTPLNGILGMTELMSSEPLAPSQRARLSVIRHSANHLLGLIGEVLDLSRIEFGRLDLLPQTVQLRCLLDEVAELLAPVAEERGLAFSVIQASDLPTTALVDPIRLKQILHNLIGNALKFTARGEVRLTADCRNGWLEFQVIDSGQGIPAVELERIFDAFEQGHNTAETRRSGTGLGLTISRQLARAMGGNVVCESTPGVGSTFIFTLPWQPAPASPVMRDPSVPPSASAGTDTGSPAITFGPWRVLVVEDNPVNALVAEGLLHQLGLQVDSVSDGAQALERLQTQRYDLVLMDCQMPVLDGWEATRRWRAWEALQQSAQRLPIIALTANAVVGDRERCLSAGMDDYLPKPFQRDELIAVIARHQPRPGDNPAPCASIEGTAHSAQSISAAP